MTVTHRKRQYQPEEIQSTSWLIPRALPPSSTSPCGFLTHPGFDYVIAVSEPGLQIECDGCACDLTHSIRIKCADPACEIGDGVDICPSCFCAGKEFVNHKRGHAYRVVVSRHHASATRGTDLPRCRNCTHIPSSWKIGVPMSEYGAYCDATFCSLTSESSYCWRASRYKA